MLTPVIVVSNSLSGLTDININNPSGGGQVRMEMDLPTQSINMYGNSLLFNDDQVSTNITKTDTGDPISGIEGQYCINTADNNFKVYADGSWRTITNW